MKNILIYIICGFSVFGFIYMLPICILSYDNLKTDFIFINFHYFLICILTLSLHYLFIYYSFGLLKDVKK